MQSKNLNLLKYYSARKLLQSWKFKKQKRRYFNPSNFDFNYSSSVNFLDITIKKSSTGELSTTLFNNKTDCYACLHRKSEHLESLKRSIPYAQALRLKRKCTEDCDFNAHCDILTKEFIDRGYKKAEIYDSISKTFDRNRENLLTPNNEPKQGNPLTLTWNRTLPNAKDVVRKRWNISQINSKVKNVFPEPPIMCFRRNKNLKGFL